MPGVDRRTFVGAVAAGVVAGSCATTPSLQARTTLDVAGFHSRRRFARTASGDIAYVEQGSGPPVLFIHGVPLNGLHWRHVMADLQGSHRCIALDLMGLGYTRIDPAQDVSFTAQARMVLQFLDALDIQRLDVVSNDSGGAVAQIFAANHPERLRSLTLTNCDVHDNWPPAAIAPSLEAARQGVLVDRYAAMMGNAEERYTRWSRAYADSRVLTDDIYRAYIEPLIASKESRNNFHRYWLAFDNAQTLAIEPRLRQLKVPTFVAWALDDIFFDVKWAHWLARTIPGTERVLEIPGARLFFPEDRPESLLPALRAFLGVAPRTA